MGVPRLQGCEARSSTPKGHSPNFYVPVGSAAASDTVCISGSVPKALVTFALPLHHTGVLSNSLEFARHHHPKRL